MFYDYDITPREFVQVFGPALEEYLENSYGKEGSHTLDLLPAASVFFEVSYHALSAFDCHIKSIDDTPSPKRSSTTKKSQK